MDYHQLSLINCYVRKDSYFIYCKGFIYLFLVRQESEGARRQWLQNWTPALDGKEWWWPWNTVCVSRCSVTYKFHIATGKQWVNYIDPATYLTGVKASIAIAFERSSSLSELIDRSWSIVASTAPWFDLSTTFNSQHRRVTAASCTTLVT